MARSDAFDAFYRELRTRLHDQTYAYTGDADVTSASVATAFTSAAQHWRSVNRATDRETWLRRAAFAAADRRRGTSTPDDALLAALQGLTARQRHLVVARSLGGASLDDVAREVRVTPAVAERELEQAYDALAPEHDRDALIAWADTSASADDPEQGRTFRRAGNRRRRTRLGLATACALAVAVVAGVLTVDTVQAPPAESAGEKTGPTASTPTSDAVPMPELGAAELVIADQLRKLDVGRSWTEAETYTDPARVADIDSCLSHTIDPDLPSMVWQRHFTAGKKKARDEAFHVIVNQPNVAEAKALYARTLRQLTTCRNRQLRAYYVVHGTGDQASELQLAYVDGSTIKASTIGLQRSGETLSLVLTRTPLDDAPDPRGMKKLLAWFNDQACPSTSGACNALRTKVTREDPPLDPSAPGFLSPADIALLPGVAKPWAGTGPQQVRTSGAATLCDARTFEQSGARDLTDRSYVIPDATKLPTLFGLTQTTARFSRGKKAGALIDDVASSIDACPQQLLSVKLDDSGTIDAGKAAQARWWTFDVRYGKGKVLRVRTAAVRVHKNVTQLTFTPGRDDLDMTDGEWRELVARATVRLPQA